MTLGISTYIRHYSIELMGYGRRSINFIRFIREPFIRKVSKLLALLHVYVPVNL